MTRRALVTGAYGFIGRNVAKHLASEGWVVAGIGHGNWGRDEWREWGMLEWHSTDITLAGLATFGGMPQMIIHCGGSGSVGFSTAHPYQDFERTVSATAAVLEYVRLYCPEAVVIYPSSAGVYGVARTLPIAESASLSPCSPYGVHKKISEDVCACYAKYFGVRTAIVRLFSIYGNGLRKQLLWDACYKLTHGETRFFGAGTETRDWLHIDDAVRLLAMAGARASIDCPVANGGAGTGVAVRDVLEELRATCGVEHELQFSGAARAGDPMHYVADISAARAWGWQPTKHWREGVREYAEWYVRDAR